MVVSGRQLMEKYNLNQEDLAALWRRGLEPFTLESFYEQHGYSLSQDEIPENAWIWVRAQGSEKEQELIDASQKGLPYGMNKIPNVPSSYAMPVRVKDPATGEVRTMIVINGHVPGLFNLYANEHHKTIALRIRSLRGQQSAGWAQLRNECHGDNNPWVNAVEGSIRRDSTHGEVPVKNRRAINPEQNVVHLSASPLESMVENNVIFELPLSETLFGMYLITNGYAEDDLGFLSKNPTVALPDGTSKTVFELVHEKEPEEALEILRQFSPPGCSKTRGSQNDSFGLTLPSLFPGFVAAGNQFSEFIPTRTASVDLATLLIGIMAISVSPFFFTVIRHVIKKYRFRLNALGWLFPEDSAETGPHLRTDPLPPVHGRHPLATRRAFASQA